MKEKQQQQAEEEGGNVLSGFGKRFLARALNIDQDIANKLISPDDEMKQIVKLKEGLSVISPKWQGQQEDEDEDDDDEDEDEDESVSRPSRRPSHGKRVRKEEEKEVEPYGKHVHKEVEKEVEPLPPRKHVHKEEEKEIEPLPPRRSRHHHDEDEDEDEDEEEKPRRTRGPTPSPKGEGHRGVEVEEDESDESVRHKTRHEKSWKEHRPAQEDVERGEAHEEWETRPSKDKRHGSNGLEETICSSKLQFNIARPKSADFYNPKAGRIKNLNSQSLPALRNFGLSAQYVVLYKVRISLHPYNCLFSNIPVISCWIVMKLLSFYHLFEHIIATMCVYILHYFHAEWNLLSPLEYGCKQCDIRDPRARTS